MSSSVGHEVISFAASQFTLKITAKSGRQFSGRADIRAFILKNSEGSPNDVYLFFHDLDLTAKEK